MKPSPRQLEFLDWEFGVFFHFGIRTFYEGHEDWDGKEMPLSGFSPSQLDCDDWIRAASQAGAREHFQIVEALETGNLELARGIMRSHLRKYKEGGK